MAVAYQDPQRPHVVTRPDGGTMSRRMADRAGYTIVPHPASGASRSSGAPSTGATAKPAADDSKEVAALVAKAFPKAVMRLPEAVCRPAAAARLASLETFDPATVAAEHYTIDAQLDRVASKLRGLPIETVEATAPGATGGSYCRTRRRVEVKMAMLPQTSEGHRLRHKLGRVLMSVDEGRDINSALTAAGFDPAAYA